MIRRELALFLAVGSTSVLLDFLVYSSIARSAVVSISVAKASSFLIGTVFTYVANRLLTFRHVTPSTGSLWRYGLLYALTLGVNVSVNALALRLLHDARVAVPLAFLTATTISASLNFLGMKWFVFRANDP